MKYKISTYILISIFQLCTISAQIFQEGFPYTQNYFSENYHTSEDQIWTIIQDNKGLMYFGNNSGLLEFDGTNWRLIQVPNKSVVRSLTIDSTGKVYVGANNELGYLDTDSSGITNYVSLLEKIPPEYNNFQDVWQIIIINEKIVFRTNQYLFIYKNNKFTIVTPENRFHMSFCVDNKYYIKDIGKGIMQLKNNSLHLIPNSDFFANYKIYVMLPYKKDQILLVSRDKGIYIFDKNLNTFTKPKSFKKADDFLIKNQIYSGIKYRNKYILGTLRNGLIVIDNSGNILKQINTKSGIRNNTIYAVYPDNHQNLWLGLNDGISLIPISSKFSLLNKQTGLRGSIYNAKKLNDELYVCTSQGVFYKNKQNLFNLIKNTKGQSWSLTDINEAIYCAHFEGILKINKSEARKISSFGVAWKILKLQNKPKIFLVGTDNGIVVFELKNNNLLYKNKLKGFNKSARYFEENNDGDIWISEPTRGLHKIKLNKSTDSVIQQTFYNKNNGLPANTYNYVFKIKTNNKFKIVFGTEEGIYTYNAKENNFVPDEKFNKLLNFSGYIDKFIQDSNGNIYFQQGKIKGKLILKNNNEYELEYKPFLKFKDIYVDDITIIDTGNIFFCTKNAIIKYQPNIKSNFDMDYSVLITKIFINNVLTNSNLQVQSEIIEIPHKRNTLKFNYSALYFQNHEKTQYSYNLYGFDENWSEWTGKTEKEYTNLPKGEYRFMVKAKNIYEKESTIAQYKFEILAPWHQTPIAYSAYVFISLLTIISIVKFYTRKLKRDKENLEIIIGKRTLEIVKQKEEIQTQAEYLATTNVELEKLSIVASKTDNAIIIMDAEGNFEWINEGFTNLYELTINELINDYGKNIIKATPNTKAQELIKSAIQNKETINYESYFITKSKKKIWNQTTMTPILDENGNIKKLIAIDTDISKLIKAEEEIFKQKEEITDSIIYAKRIQSALFPSKEIIKKSVNEYFILDMPRGIVSGDFYWFSEIKNKIIIAVADCTGHGVPGAFMSMLGVTFLNKIVIEKGIIKPNEILDRLRKNVISSLHQTGKTDEANDGMDISLITIDKKNNTLEFAGANNSAYLFINNELVEIFADKMPIAFSGETETPFSCQKIPIQTGDIIYLFTDGYADQFGGLKGRKFLYKNFKLLLKNIHQLPMNEQEKKLFKTHRKWKDNNEQVDDILVMGIKI